MPTIGLFIPDDKKHDDWEINHFGVAVRCRAGRLELVDDVAVENEGDVAEYGKQHASGHLVYDRIRGGTWIVPVKHTAAFERQWGSEIAEAASRQPSFPIGEG